MSFKERCTNHVVELEDKHVHELFKVVEDARNRAEKCGCHQCTGYYEKASFWLSQELERITPKHEDYMDHEEVALMNWALSNLDNET